MSFQAVYFGHFLSFYTMQLGPPKPQTTPSRGPERVQRGGSPAPLPRRGPAAGTMSPFLGRPPRAPRSHPVIPGAQASGVRKSTTASGKPTLSTESVRSGRGAAHHAGPLWRAAGHNQSTRTGAKQQQPPGPASPESAHNTQQTTAREQVPTNTSRHLNRRGRALRVPSPCRLRNSRRPDGQVSAPQRHPAHATHNATHGAGPPVNRS